MADLQPVQDYREINKAMIKNQYPLPIIQEIMDKLKDAIIFTKMDVRKGYNNIQIKKGDEWKAAFKTNEGLFKPLVMFFGLCNAPATFQSFMDHIFEEVKRKGYCIIYMDDILIFSSNWEHHQQAVRDVLEVLRRNKLCLKAEKCEFHKSEMEFLGFIVGNGQVKMDQGKITAVRDWKSPRNKKELQTFLGFANFY